MNNYRIQEIVLSEKNISLDIVTNMAVIIAFFGSDEERIESATRAFQKILCQSIRPVIFFSELTYKSMDRNFEFVDDCKNCRYIPLVATEDHEFLFQKEAMYNYVVKNFCNNIEILTFLDCEVYCEDKNWFKKIKRSVESNPNVVLQPFKNVKDTKENLLSNFISIGSANYIKNKNYNFSPGFVWSFTKKCFDEIGGWNPWCIEGCGDSLFVHECLKDHKYSNNLLKNKWVNDLYRKDIKKLSVDFLDVKIFHENHGSFKDRNRNSLKRNIDNFGSLSNNIELDKNGLLKWKNRNNELYFFLRTEKKINLSVIIPIFDPIRYKLRNFWFVLKELIKCNFFEIIVCEQVNTLTENSLMIENFGIKHIKIYKEGNKIDKNTLIKKGLDVASGDYVWIHDSDYFLSFENVASKLDGSQKSIIVFDKFIEMKYHDTEKLIQHKIDIKDEFQGIQYKAERNYISFIIKRNQIDKSIIDLSNAEIFNEKTVRLFLYYYGIDNRSKDQIGSFIQHEKTEIAPDLEIKDTSIIIAVYGFDRKKIGGIDEEGKERLKAVKESLDSVLKQIPRMQIVFVELINDSGITFFPYLSEEHGVHHIKIYGNESNEFLFQKECLYNIGVKSCDSEYLIFLDSDISSYDLNWLYKIRLKIIENKNKLIQGFNRLRDTKDWTLDCISLAAEKQGIKKIGQDRGAVPGGCWGMTRNYYNQINGLNPWGVFGSGDVIFLYELVKNINYHNVVYKWFWKVLRQEKAKQDIDFVDVDCIHHFHGPGKNRSYHYSRMVIDEVGGEIENYIGIDKFGLLYWKNQNSTLRKCIERKIELNDKNSMEKVIEESRKQERNLPIIGPDYDMPKDFIDDMSVIIVFFGDDFRRINGTQLALRQILKQKPRMRIVFIELVFSEEEGKFQWIENENNVKYLKICGNDTNKDIFQKEALYNLAVDRFCRDCKYLAFIDCDIFSNDLLWFSKIRQKLIENPFKIIQGFYRVTDTEDEEFMGFSLKASKEEIKDKNFGCPGFCWAMTLKTFDSFEGFNPYGITSCGDALFVHECIKDHGYHLESFKYNWYKSIFREDRNKFYIEYVNVDLKHVFHGRYINRKYIESKDLVEKFGQNIKNLIGIDINGLLYWKETDCELRKNIVENNKKEKKQKIIMKFSEIKNEEKNKIKDIINDNKITHVYDNILGYFDFKEIYLYILEKVQNESHFVQIGVDFGKSISFLVVEKLNRKKNIKIDAVDKWSTLLENSPSNERELIKSYGGNKYDAFKGIMEKYNLFKEINVIRLGSKDASEKYENNSLDFVFLDSSIKYKEMKEDLIFWYPKVKKTGFIGGHDYDITKFPEVKKAVLDFFRDKHLIGCNRSSWLVSKSEILPKGI